VISSDLTRKTDVPTPSEEVYTHFLEPLRTACVSSFDGPHFRSALLFEKWFRQQGVSYFFLFRKNVSCTNLQFAELFALLRVHTSDPLRGRRQLHFVTLKEFLTQIDSIVHDLQTSRVTPSQLPDTFVSLYSEMFWSMVVVEPLYGSCTAFLPRHLSLDLFRVCGESGYIHSCGINVYTRSLNEADREGLTTAVESHLAKTPALLKSFFTVYAHEDFTQYDRDDAADLRDGLDDVKIFVEKYYLSDHRFVSVLEHINKRLGSRIAIPGPGDYHTAHQEARRNGQIDTSHTLWLIVDRGLTEDPPFRGDERFLVCYDQFYRNENPFHIFDENKPAWVSHTTIPHTLAGAMINITRPWWPANRQVSVSDPFSGTGTIWLECAKFQNVSPRCADLEPITPLLAEDNLRFFS
jgi:hypothetical protein